MKNAADILKNLRPVPSFAGLIDAATANEDETALENLLSRPLFAELIRIMETGKFIAPDNIITTAPGIKYVEMIIVEKALATIISKYRGTVDKIHNAIDNLYGGDYMDYPSSQKTEEEMEERLKERLSEHCDLFEMADVANTHLWESINSRLKQECSQFKTPSISIQCDFNISIRESLLEMPWCQLRARY